VGVHEFSLPFLKNNELPEYFKVILFSCQMLMKKPFDYLGIKVPSFHTPLGQQKILKIVR